MRETEEISSRVQECLETPLSSAKGFYRARYKQTSRDARILLRSTSFQPNLSSLSLDREPRQQTPILLECVGLRRVM